MSKKERNRLTIKNAYYLTKNNQIVSPQFTGEHFIVDCIIYKTKEDLNLIYNEDFIEDNKHNYISLNNNQYFYAEYEPMIVSWDWELISDITNLDLNDLEDMFFLY